MCQGLQGSVNGMPTTKAVSSRATVGSALRYIEKSEKTAGGKLIDSVNCDVRSANEEFEQVRNYYNKTDGRQYKHYVIAFDPNAEQQPTPEEAMKICKEVIQNTPHLQGFQCVVAVHTDKAHTHAHIVVNSVSLIDGHKLNESKADLQKMKKIQNEICKAYGFEPPQKNKTIGEVRSFDTNTYKTIENKGQSAEIVQVYQAVKKAKTLAELPEQFCDILQEQGIAVRWKDSRKYIVFTTVTGKKFRDKNLSKTFSDDVSKESLLNEFCANRRSKQIENTGRTADRREEQNSDIEQLKRETEDILDRANNGKGKIEQPSIIASIGKSELEKHLEELSREASDRSEREQEAADRVARETAERIAKEEIRIRPKKQGLERARTFSPER